MTLPATRRRSSPRSSWLGAGLLTLSLAACKGDGGDGRSLREPWGAHVVGMSRPVLARRDGVGERTVIPATASLPAASYTADQAARGAAVYQATCARCHPPSEFEGENFAVGWNEARAVTLFSTLRNTMPQDKPGSLTDGQYADVIAYVLRRNRVPAGAVALPPDTAALRQLRIDVPPTR